MLSLVHQYIVYICFGSKVIQQTLEKCKTLTQFCESLYMDNILIVTPDNKKLHEEIVHAVLDVKKESLFLKAKKCCFEQDEVNFLGYLISRGMIKVDPSKRHGLVDWPRVLKNVKEV
jgi:hypothetical protein